MYDTHFYSSYRYSDDVKQLSAVYNKYQLKGMYALYPKVSDCLKLNMPDEYLELSMGFPLAFLNLTPSVKLGDQPGYALKTQTLLPETEYQLELSTQEANADLSYSIGKEKGTIPFAWQHSTAEAEAETRMFKLNLGAEIISPMVCDSLYNNSINALLLHAAMSYKPSLKCRFAINANYLDSSADLRYNDGVYGSIENLRALNISTSVQRDFSHLSCKLGFATYFSGIGSDSYVDIWPFTFLDTFLSHRTRIKKLGVEVYSPEAELSYRAKNDPAEGLDYRISLAYHHLFHNENVVIKNRKAVIYPFLFTYTTNTYNWHDELDAYIHVPIMASYTLGKAKVQLNLAQLVPIKWSKVSPSSTPSPEPSQQLRKREWGGLSCGINFSYIY